MTITETTRPVALFHTEVCEEAIQRVTETLRSGWLNEGAITAEFESRLDSDLGLRNAVALNSGTSALQLALQITGVGPGDEVILPAQTFVATGLTILSEGATPVFADVNPDDLNISVDSIAERITERTKAIMPVHWGGYPCDMDAINELAAKHQITVIEDAAHALGAWYKGRLIGSISSFTCFSFQSIKHLTTGDGGALACLNAEDAHEAKKRRWFGIDRSKINRTVEGDRGVDIDVVGHKFHMNNVIASLGLGQLGDFPRRQKRRADIAKLYTEDLQGVPGLTLMKHEADRQSAYWLFDLHVERREDFCRKLSEHKIASSVVDLGIDRNSVFGRVWHENTGQRQCDLTHVAIPIHEGMDDSDVSRIVQVIRSGW
jgi:perosamine synthetase